jgi:hypothetical protein
MGKLPLALIGVGRSDLDHIIHTTAKMDGGAQSVYRGWAKRVPSREEANDEDYYLPVSDEFLLERDKSLAQIVESDLREFHNIALAESRSRGGVYDDTPPSEVAEALRAQEPPLLHEIMEQGLLWATAPDVWEHFGCRPVKGTPFPPDVQAELLEEVKDQKEHSKIVASGLGPCSFTKVQSGY